MKTMHRTKNSFLSARMIFVSLLLLIPCAISCEDFLSIDEPTTELVKETVFNDDKTASAAVLSIYGQMMNSGFASGDVNGASFLCSLSSDELQNGNSGFALLERQQFNDNELLPSNQLVTGFWTDLYQYIFKANMIIEGLSKQSGVSEEVSDQLIGEAKFIRALSHFYLVNLFGDIPLVLTSDFRTNSEISRTKSTLVYEQIIYDLLDAQSRLSSDYSFSMGERTRPNKWTATALLSRVYLFLEDWENADLQASAVIDNTTLYSLNADLDDVFLANSNEAIWQLERLQNTAESQTYIFSDLPQNAALTDSLLAQFETDDLRKSKWIGSTSDGGNTYYYPYKYKVIGITDPVQEYSVVLRLAEQYLIRAEARMRLGDLSAAEVDINIIRNRAGLPNVLGNDSTTLFFLIEQERRVEFFTEWGHRWLDLKRTNRSGDLLANMKPQWQSFDNYYPIPQVQMENDINITQNDGY